MGSLSFPYNSDESGGRPVRKRKSREAYGLNEVVVAPGALGSPKFVERVQVKTIETPPVRLLDREELERRGEVLVAYRKGLETGSGADDSKNVATSLAANLVAATVAKELLGDEGSSEEDISDEAYEQRHREQEEEERNRYNSFISSANARKTIGDGRGRSMMAADVSEKGKRSKSVSDTSDIENAKTPILGGKAGIQTEQSILHTGDGQPFKQRPRRGRPPGSGRRRTSTTAMQ